MSCSYNFINEQNLVENNSDGKNPIKNTSTNNTGPIKGKGVHNHKTSTRVRRIPRYLNDYIHQVNQSLSKSLCVKNGLKTSYPISNILSYDSLSKKHLKYTLTITASSEPGSYDEAKINPKWQHAMQKEIKAL